MPSFTFSGFLMMVLAGLATRILFQMLFQPKRT